MGPTGEKSWASSLFEPASRLLKPVMISVSGYDPPMQFFHEDDLAELIVTLLNHKQPGIFNIAGEGTIHYSELARLSQKKLAKLPAGLLYFLMDLS